MTLGKVIGTVVTTISHPDFKKRRLLVVQPLPGWPAIEAGLRAGDLILEADGIELQGMSLYEAVSLIRGPAGTTVRLLVEREDVDEPFELEVERALET